jgi:uracil-DNA glycosylase
VEAVGSPGSAGKLPEPDAESPGIESASLATRCTDDSASLAKIERQVAACHKCALAEGRIHTVFGTGSTHAQWMIVGEAPGAEEDRRGEPFVGRAGQLLNAMIASLGLRRDEVYIANVLKCRPPNNRDPLGHEVGECLPYLLAQIRIVRPGMILALGRFAAQALLQSSAPIGQLRGHLHHYGEFRTPLVVSYHPAYLLRSPLEKRKAWQDLKFARRSLEGEGG